MERTSTDTAAGVLTVHRSLWRIPATSRTARGFVADWPKAHSAVYSMFSGRPVTTPGGGPRLLYAARTTPAGLDLIVSAPFEPTVGLPEATLLDSAAVRLRLAAGQTGVFQVLAAATCRVSDGRKRGRRVAITGQDGRAAWLTRVLTAGGLTPADVQVIPQPDRPEAGGFKREYWPVMYRGSVTVTDPHTAALTLASGIGRGRAYGFGLILTKGI